MEIETNVGPVEMGVHYRVKMSEQLSSLLLFLFWVVKLNKNGKREKFQIGVVRVPDGRFSGNPYHKNLQTLLFYPQWSED